MGSQRKQVFPRVSFLEAFWPLNREAFLRHFLVKPLLVPSAGPCMARPALRPALNCSARTTHKPAFAGGMECKSFSSQVVLLSGFFWCVLSMMSHFVEDRQLASKRFCCHVCCKRWVYCLCAASDLLEKVIKIEQLVTRCPGWLLKKLRE